MNNITPPHKKHNSTIAIWKFLFSLLILFRHAEIYNPAFADSSFNFIGGSIAIFFFFIVSGYLMTNTALKQEIPKDSHSLGKLTFRFIWKKIVTFFPYIFIGIVAGMIVNAIRGEKIDLQVLLNSVFSFSVVPQSFIAHRKFLGVAWYISVMLVGMMILFPLIVKYRRNFILIVCPLLALLLFSFMNKMDGGSYSHSDIYYFGYLPKSLLSAIAGLSVGGLAFLFTEKINSVKFRTVSKILLTLLCLAGFSSVFVISCLPNSHQRFDSFMIVVLFLGVGIAFSNIPITRKITDNKLVFFLEKLSLPLYLNHMWIMNAMILVGFHTNSLPLFIAVSASITIVVSTACYFVVNSITKKHLMLRARSIFIQP